MFNSLIHIPLGVAKKYPDRVSHRYRVKGGLEDKTYSQFVSDIKKLAMGFFQVGIREFDHVSFFVNNRYEWALTDYALQSLRAISVPRGSDTSPIEAEFIYNHSDSKFVIFETLAQVKESKGIADKAEKILLVEDCEIPEEYKGRIELYSQLFKVGEKEDYSTFFDNLISKIEKDDIVSIIYTSGTTGNPKGVVLTQNQFVENVKMTFPRMGIDESVGEVTVTILPAWHAFERTFEYAGMSGGISFVYSNLKYFGADVSREKPHILASVPRVWDSIYTKMNQFLKQQSKFKRKLFMTMVNLNYKYKKSLASFNRSCLVFEKPNIFKVIGRSLYSVVRIIGLFLIHVLAERLFANVREKVGGRLRCAISGGGSLPVAIDRFFYSVGIEILNAYGMTECAPGIASRSIKRNTLGSIGTPFNNTLLKILDDEQNEVPVGEKGTLYVKGPQIMSGYYKNPEATNDILTRDGWLCTGDLARKSYYGDYVLVGRSKDTIVLLGGENIDPLSIEDKIQESEMIDHVMLLGQDKKGLTAFIALNEEALSHFADELKIKITDIFSFFNHDDKEPSEEYKMLEKKVQEEVDKKINKQTGFKPFEKITKVILVKNSFKIGKELTQTLKIKRKQIEEIYHKIISRFMDDNNK